MTLGKVDKVLMLASGSSRRLDLLRRLGFAPLARPVDIDESALDGESPRALVRRLALAKARAGAEAADIAADTVVDTVVLGGDTVVVHSGRVIGKPRDREDFLATFPALGDKEHRVLSGVATVAGGREAVMVVETRVCFGPVSRAAALRYWESGEAADKAGGYAIQGLGARFVTGIVGSYSNVVGLPLCATARLLAAAGLDLSSADPAALTPDA